MTTQERDVPPITDVDLSHAVSPTRASFSPATTKPPRRLPAGFTHSAAGGMDRSSPSIARARTPNRGCSSCSTWRTQTTPYGHHGRRSPQSGTVFLREVGKFDPRCNCGCPTGSASSESGPAANAA